jgi:hypothetical protein
MSPYVGGGDRIEWILDWIEAMERREDEGGRKGLTGMEGVDCAAASSSSPFGWWSGWRCRRHIPQFFPPPSAHFLLPASSHFGQIQLSQ